MKFEEITTQDKNKDTLLSWGGTYIKKSNNYYLHIGPVVFGWRIRLYHPSESMFLLDLCAGDDPKLIGTLYRLTELWLEHYGVENLEKFPQMRSRPYFTDPEFTASLVNDIIKKVENCENIKEKVLDLNILNKGRMRSFEM